MTDTSPLTDERLPAGLELRPLTIPVTLEEDDAADLLEMVRVRNAVYRELDGDDDDALTAAELLPRFQSTEYQHSLRWLAVLDGDVVGRAIVDMPREEGSRVAFVTVELLRRAWGSGIGTAAADLLERTALEHGRTVLQSWANHVDEPGAESLEAPTGFGVVPLDHAARFLQRRGYGLEQIERKSALPLTDETYAHVEALLADAKAAAPGYRILQWSTPTPPEHIDGYAWLKSRMVTDAPSAGIEFDEEVWDAARVADHERPYLESGRRLLVTAAEHIASGELAAFNELAIGPDRTSATQQEDTLVLADHRGHRLGMLVKCAGLLAWREIAPQSPRVVTYNAEENRPMLDINERIGFVPVTYNGAWKKTVTA